PREPQPDCGGLGGRGDGQSRTTDCRSLFLSPNTAGGQVLTNDVRRANCPWDQCPKGLLRVKLCCNALAPASCRIGGHAMTDQSDLVEPTPRRLSKFDLSQSVCTEYSYGMR